ncbi:hypothetical protein BDZ94DRAFT_1317312 [Collybia nuda]|uniref:Heterokaryon incompatibility domain-containing protein n=1 Tax=Collybia nuda TaxID=64659 RepID=A0A9P5YKC8_9AGAR|nr:hypothetical protein BDZ94DRAFT_1317312 [Collybia nuda]
MENIATEELVEAVHGKRKFCGSFKFSQIWQRVSPSGSPSKLLVVGSKRRVPERGAFVNNTDQAKLLKPSILTPVVGMLGKGREMAINNLDHESERGPVPGLDFPQSWKRIFSCPLTQLAGKSLDITPYATPGRYRMVSLHNLRQFGNFEIFEFDELPQPDVPYIPAYTAISYVWRGINADNDLPSSQRANSKGDFTVKGEENASPISITVITDIAWGALRKSASSGCGPDRFLWLDQFCIMQTSKEDKAWQISRMYSIYRHSRCIILPGGLTRLASLEDATHWMSRAWTLQEVLAPPFILSQDVDTCVLFMNDAQTHKVIEGVDKNEWGDTPYLTDGIIACAPLMPLLGTLLPFRQSLFGFRGEQLDTLNGAMNKTMDASKVLIWRSAFSRTSSRPADMIFSIMQCFGITLRPQDFENDDRVGATIALVQAILNKPGGRAYWIPALYFLPPAPELSVFPRFPQTRVDGAAAIRLPDGSTKDVIDLLTDNNIVKLDNTSHIGRPFEWDGSQTMDDQGYYSFVAKQVYTLKTVLVDPKSLNDCHVLRAGDGSTWALNENPANLNIGTANDSIEYLPDADDIEGDVLAVFIGDRGVNYVYMLVKKHGPRKYHRFTYLIENQSLSQWGALRSNVRVNIGPFPASEHLST